MSRNTDRIRKAAADIGVKIDSIVWQPIGPNFEMMGCSGGWIVNGEAIALNVADAIDFIQKYPDAVDRDYEAPDGH